MAHALLAALMALEWIRQRRCLRLQLLVRLLHYHLQHIVMTEVRVYVTTSDLKKRYRYLGNYR